jgi:glyoxylase I family protein
MPDSTAPTLAGASHLGLTVRDMDVSAEWYQRVFGWQVLRRMEAGEGAASPRVLLLDPATFFVVGLCQYDDRSGDRFDHRRTGLDHYAFLVAEEGDLGRWIEHLDAVGVEHSPVRDVPGLGKFVSLDDPDGIQFELWVNAGG